MLSKDIFGYLSITVALASYVFYFASVIRGQTKPHAFSWITWSIITFIVFYAQYSNDAGPGAWGTGIIALSCAVVAVMAFFWGEKDIRKSDWVMFISALVIIPVWCFTSNPMLAVIMSIMIDAFGGYYPTFRKSWHKPHEEQLQLYIIGVPQLVCTLLAMEHYYLVNILYPLFVLIGNVSFVLMVLWRRRTYVGN